MTNHSPLRELCALSLAALVGGSAASASAQTVTLSRNQARPTSELTVTARGFSTGESVELWLGEEPVRTTVVDATGTGGPWSVRVPAESLPGELVVSVVGEGDAVAEAALLVTTPWGQYGYDQQRTRFNPHENVLTAAAVSARGLRRKWRVTSKGPFDSVITHRYIFKNQQQLALDPKTGTVLWGGDVIDPAAQGWEEQFTGWTSSAAVYGRTYSTTERSYPTFAWWYTSFDVSECGPGIVCRPTVHYPLPAVPAGPVAVADGRVFLAAGSTLYAFDALCEGASCGPQWTATRGGQLAKNALVVNQGRVYVVRAGAAAGGQRNDVLSVYPASCGTSGAECAPLWESPLGLEVEAGLSVSNGRLFTYAREPGGGARLVAFRERCAEGGGACRALWRSLPIADRTSYPSMPAIAHGRAYAADGSTYAVDCARDGRECTPLWQYRFYNNMRGDITIAGDVVYAVNAGQAMAFAADCTGGGDPCLAIAGGESLSEQYTTGSVTVSDGVAYLGGGGYYFYALDLRPAR